MCGIAGLIERTGQPSAELAQRARKMAEVIAHRGPDDQGIWVEPGMGMALAHRRLSIIDLSPLGHQPMTSASGRYVIVFNGEIYNYRDLRSQLQSAGLAPRWRSESDTEVLLAGCDAWGIEETLRKANGMFALAIADLSRRSLVLARDRMGEKPLYYGWQGDSFLFGSELKALDKHPAFLRQIEPRAVALYYRFGYVPAPWSIYRDIRKLPPAHYIEITDRESRSGVETPIRYWNLPAPTGGASLTQQDATEHLDSLLRDAVRIRMRSDVPLGAFLSGGVDSTTIVALMQAQSSQPIRSFSIGFRERDHDESMHARAVAGVLGTSHTELRVTPADALSVVPQLPDLYDEPFADSSQIPTYLLAKLTRMHVTVALSGDGGDELFGGYHRYLQGRRLLTMYRFAPRSARSLLGRALRAVPAASLDRVLQFAPTHMAALLGGGRLSKLADTIDCEGAQDLYKRLVSQWHVPTQAGVDVDEPSTVIDDPATMASMRSSIGWMMYLDQQTYLPDDILVKVDRATMSVGLEARVPFLDHRVVEFAASLPEHLKVRDSVGKWLLRQVLYRYVDARRFARPKQGFAIPLADWLRGPLRDWAEQMLSAEALARSGFLDVRFVRAAWDAHISGKRNLQHPLWVILMFQAWCSRMNVVRHA